MNKDQVMSLARALFLTGGTVLVQKGLADNGNMEAVVGGLCALISLVWSWITHKSDPKQ